MTLKELLKTLNKIKKTHPEAKDATVFMRSFHEQTEFQVQNIGYSKRYTPNRVFLED